MSLESISVDSDKPKYRQLKRGSDILEHTLEAGEITIDWVNGRNAASMMKTVMAADGEGIRKISGYLTDKLGDASYEVLLRLANQVARQIGGNWSVSLETIEGRRYVIFTSQVQP